MPAAVLPLFALILMSLASAGASAMSVLPSFFAREAVEAAQSGEEDRVILEYENLIADKVLVKKAERRLYLLKNDKPFRSYQVSLGSNPVGHKERQGDGRTPEGVYTMTWRNPKSQFRKALHISYPNANDRVQAERLGVNPGGMIAIHGQPRPNAHRELQELLSGDDWTQGCIAVSNMEIDEIWELTREGTLIEIRP
ncbi:MAG: L,D-transpeptidase family protein [Chromatiaceae bacterium]|jgi:murein L,D-transpeptidase YafK|nr:L,D-transpeptidase family protein [Chromatiaceae bacterium]